MAVPLWSANQERAFLRMMSAAGSADLPMAYNLVSRAFANLIPTRMVTLWACSPEYDYMSLLSIHPSVLLQKQVLSCRRSLSGAVIESRRMIATSDVRVSGQTRAFGERPIIDTYGLCSMISVPLLNSFNSNDCRHVLNLFPTEKIDRRDVPEPGRRMYEELARHAAVALENALEEACLSAVEHVGAIARRVSDVPTFLRGLNQLVRELLTCEGCTIFVSQDRVDSDAPDAPPRVCGGTARGVTSGLSPRSQPADGLVEQAWRSNQPFLMWESQPVGGERNPLDQVLGVPGGSVESSPRSAETDLSVERLLFDGLEENGVLLFPMARPDEETVPSEWEVLGVVRCRNKRGFLAPGRVRAFSDNDCAIMEAVTFAAVPYLKQLLNRGGQAPLLSP